MVKKYYNVIILSLFVLVIYNFVISGKILLSVRDEYLQYKINNNIDEYLYKRDSNNVLFIE